MATVAVLVADFDILGNLGQGSFSKVFKVRRKSDPDGDYVLKETRCTGLSPQAKANVLREVEMLKVGHGCEYIIQYYAAFMENDNCYVVRTTTTRAGCGGGCTKYGLPWQQGHS